MAEMQQPQLVVRFFLHPVQDVGESKKHGRPIYNDVEHVEIRFPGDRQRIHVAPAHEVFERKLNPRTGDTEGYTYAMVHNDQYRAFKNGSAELEISGTRLEEVPFLTQSKRLELRALNIHTLETLAALDGAPLKALGMGGRSLKAQAQAFIEAAEHAASPVVLAAENQELKAQMAAMQQQMAELMAGLGTARGEAVPGRRARTIDDVAPDEEDEPPPPPARARAVNMPSRQKGDKPVKIPVGADPSFPPVQTLPDLVDD